MYFAVILFFAAIGDFCLCQVCVLARKYKTMLFVCVSGLCVSLWWLMTCVMSAKFEKQNFALNLLSNLPIADKVRLDIIWENEVY